MKPLNAQKQEMGTKTTSSSNIEQAVRKLQRVWLEAAPQRDIATIARILPDGFVFASNLFGAFSKARFLEVIRSGELRFESINRDEVTISSFGNMAVATGRDMVIGRYRDQDISGHYRFTNVYVEQQGHWQVVSSHARCVA